jgi:hypothetical protein
MLSRLNIGQHSGLPINSHLLEGNMRWLFYDETYLPEPMPIRLQAARLNLSTAFKMSKDMPGAPLTAHIGLFTQMGVEIYTIHTSCADTALLEGSSCTDDGAFRLSPLGALYSYKQVTAGDLGDGQTNRSSIHLTLNRQRSRISSAGITMRNKHSPWIALAHAVLADDAKFYHFENGEAWRGCHPKDVVTTEYLQKIVNHATNNGGPSSTAHLPAIKIRFEVPQTGSRSELSLATNVDLQKDLHPFFYPPSFGTRKRKREAEQLQLFRPTMSLVDAEILEQLEGTSRQQLRGRTSNNTATGTSLTASQPRMAKPAIWVLAMIMHPFFDRWPSNTADREGAFSSVRVACKQTVDAHSSLDLWSAGAGRQISALCPVSIRSRLEMIAQPTQ